MVDYVWLGEKPVSRSDLFAAAAMHAILSSTPLEEANFKEIAELAWAMDEWMRSEGPEDGA